MFGEVKDQLRYELSALKGQGLNRDEIIIDSAQGSHVLVDGKSLLNLCATNYLGLSSDSKMIRSAREGLARYGLGVSSVRFICGTQCIHKVLERAIAEFLSFEGSIIYGSAYDANGGLFQTLLDERDVVIGDLGNHASSVEGIKLCRAKSLGYSHGNLHELEASLLKARSGNPRRIMIATNGVFPMDGYVADLKGICDLAERYEALVMVDESHATGCFGPTGRGSIEYTGVMGRVDIVTSTLGKALGGACGGFVAGHQEIIDILRQKSRPYLFSNSLPPPVVTATIACFERISKDFRLLRKLEINTKYFRKAIQEAGYRISAGEHPLISIKIGSTETARAMVSKLIEHGILTVALLPPVMAEGDARIRVIISAAHSRKDLQFALDAFEKVGSEFSIGNY